MPIQIEMPKLSDTMTEGVLVKWRKNVGDKIEMGDILAEVETDKATMEMEAFDEGILHKQMVEEGGKAAVGSAIAMLLEEGEEPPADEAEASEKRKKPEQKEEPAPKADKPDKAKEREHKEQQSGERVKASPFARKLAAEHGVKLSSLKGTGPGGRIVAADVRSGGQAGGRQPKAAPAAAPVDAGESTLTPLSGMRRVIAQRLLESKTQIPHFYLFAEVDVADLMKFRKSVNDAGEASGQGKITVNDLLLKAVVAAAQRHPKVNATFSEEGIRQFSQIHLSVAVAVEEGLVTPVVRDAGNKSLRQISESVKDLATRARSKSLKPEEYTGGTITVSNLGSYGVESFSAIINPPQSLIVSVGAIVKKPVVDNEDRIVVGQRMTIGLSCDHRVVDGAIGAEYLAELKRLLESPALMLL